ncbi:MAG TPA: galactose-1-phosphate uridylyltransferase [Methylomirabilota bacterium]|nr:galactose-1-phosphate uridylyltransferase [Methylomirabilota bacterium]
MPEFRKDPVVDRWVIISTERAKRPQDHAGNNEQEQTDSCPFCAGNEAMTPPAVLTYPADEAHPSNTTWAVRVVPNKYPALVDEGSWKRQTGIYESMSGLGVHEVIIESPEHVVNVAMLSETELEKVLHAYRDRMATLRNDKRWRAILIYKNQGAQAGATLEHIHSQLIALPAVPKEVFEEVTGAKVYHSSHGRCVYCDMINEEIGGAGRLVAEDEWFVALCPFASRFPYETWILPRQHASSFESGSNGDFTALARSLRATLIRLNRRLENPPFNYIIHSSPLDETENAYHHWHIEILPKLTQVAGFEWGSGSYINTVAPEDAARLLREATF